MVSLPFCVSVVTVLKASASIACACSLASSWCIALESGASSRFSVFRTAAAVGEDFASAMENKSPCAE